MNTAENSRVSDHDEAVAQDVRPGAPVPRRRRRPPRKFVIHSTFGSSRRPRSRKNRPCDACRKRKTACVITADPPCQSCKRRGIPCQSTAPISSQVVFDAGSEHASTQQQPFLSPSTPTITDGGSRSPVRPRASPCDSSPALFHQQHVSHPSSSNDPAVLVHQTFLHHQLTPSTVDTEGTRPVLVTNSAASAAPYTLEDIPGRCAYFMGRPSEQDGFLLDAFRYGILRDNFSLSAHIAKIQPCSPTPSSDQEIPVHFLFLRIGHPDHVNREKDFISKAIEAKVWPHGDNLVRLFFRHVHPVFPILSKVRFLSRYGSDKTSIPACLRGAVYALASAFWSHDSTLKDITMPYKQHELADYANQVLRREIENPNLFILQACLLLQHVTPPAIDTLEAPTTWTSAAQATACAQMIGLHMEPGQWNINVTERHLRRKLWWATFYADCWSSVCHGNPPHVSSSSYTTTALTMDDMRCDEEVPEDLRQLVEPEDARFQVSTGARFLQLIDIARSLRIVLDSNYQVNPGPRLFNDVTQPQAELLAVEANFRDWTSLIPSCLDVQVEKENRKHASSHNCSLHLSFYSARVLVYRALMHPSTRDAKFKPGSNLRKWFPEALLAFDAFLVFLSRVDKTYLRGFWGRHARSQLVLCGNFLVFLFMLASERRDIERAYGLLETFHQTMDHLWVGGDELVTTMLRAAKDRIDSFFAQAAEIMRRGTDGVASIVQSS